MRLSRSGILSVLLHALAFYGLMRADWRTPRPAAQPRTAVVWFAAPQGQPPPSASEERSSPAEPTSASQDGSHAKRPAVRARSAPASRAPPEEPHATPAPTAQAPDLGEARRRATTDALRDAERADAHRSFAFPGTIGQQRAFDESERIRRREQGLQPPLTVFDSPAKGRAALPEPPVVAYGVHWVSDDCYVFREPLDRFILPGVFVPPVTCTRRLARTDLFLTAKPSYLMDDEERAAVAADTQRRELLRRPTTGTVMPLAGD